MIFCPIKPEKDIPFPYLLSDRNKTSTELFSELFYKENLSASVNYRESGQPFLCCEQKELPLTASHSGRYTVVAYLPSDGFLGADLQLPVDWSNEEKRRLAFSEREIASAKNDPDKFTFLWTAKEAVLKALGIGLSKGFRYVEILTDYSTHCTLNFVNGDVPAFIDPAFFTLPMPEGCVLIFAAGRAIIPI